MCVRAVHWMSKSVFTTVVGYSLNQIVQGAFASQILDEGKKVKV